MRRGGGGTEPTKKTKWWLQRSNGDVHLHTPVIYKNKSASEVPVSWTERPEKPAQHVEFIRGAGEVINRTRVRQGPPEIN